MIGNHVYPLRVSRVRIPCPPPYRFLQNEKSPETPCFRAFLSFKTIDISDKTFACIQNCIRIRSNTNCICFKAVACWPRKERSQDMPHVQCPPQPIQKSESILVASLLAVAGGYMDAYSYMGRGHVFANAETGNVVLLGIELMRGDAPAALRYLLPIACFVAGTLLAVVVKSRSAALQSFHWREIVILLEVSALLLAGFLPRTLDGLVNALISFTCGLQLSTFQAFRSHPMATTMCTGNLKTGTHHLHHYLRTHERKQLRIAGLYYVCILFFIAGAILGALLTTRLLERAAMGAAALLFPILLIMHDWRREEGGRKRAQRRKNSL